MHRKNIAFFIREWLIYLNFIVLYMLQHFQPSPRYIQFYLWNSELHEIQSFFLSLFFYFHIQRDRVRVTMHFSHIKKSFLKNDFDSSKLERGFNMDKI